MIQLRTKARMIRASSVLSVGRMIRVIGHTAMVGLILAGGLGLQTLAGLPAASASQSQFKQDLDALTKNPHRLAGSPAGHAAADYIERRLNDIGVDRVMPLEFAMWQTKVGRCELQIGGKTISLKPMRPNVVANPVTDKEGITGPLIYAGQGRLEDYGKADPEGSIVVLDYASRDNWLEAFSLGAKAVIFIGDQTPATINTKPMHAGVPARLMRFFAKADPKTGKVQGVDLTKSRKKVTLRSRVTWERSHRGANGKWSYVGRDVIGIIRGTRPAFASKQDRPEAIVLAAHFDSFGNVPQLSPGARSAANVSALLEAAQRMVKDRPRRDVVLLFIDNESRGQQGAHEFYDSLFMPDDQHQALLDSHETELSLTRSALDLLKQKGLDFRPDDRAGDYLLKKLTSVADWQADDLTRKLQIRRLHWKSGNAQNIPSKNERDDLEEKAKARNRRWDAIQRAMHNDRPQRFLAEQQRYANGRFTKAEQNRWDKDKRQKRQAKAKKRLESIQHLIERTSHRMSRRLMELALAQRIDGQRTALREALYHGDQREWITAHATYNLGDASTVWGPVIGTWISEMFPWNGAQQGMDESGFYTRFLGALRQAAGPRPEDQAIEPTTLREHNFASTFIPNPIITSGSVAGEHGIYHFAMMTGYDATIREGHPSDTVKNLNWKRLRSQALSATRLLDRLADAPALSQPRRFQVSAKSKYPSFADGKVDGSFAKLQISGGLSETRPASGALMASWPSSKTTGPEAFNSLSNALETPAFEPIRYHVVDMNGRFALKGVRKDVGHILLTLGSMFDRRGRIKAISSSDSLTNNLTKAIRVDLFPSNSYEFTWPRTYPTKPNGLKILEARSNSSFRPTRSLTAELGATAAFFVSDQVIDQRFKVFQRMGPVGLGKFTPKRPTGTGVGFSRFVLPPRLAPIAANDLWQLNERRFQRLRSRGVTSADIERLHSQAQRWREQAQAKSPASGTANPNHSPKTDHASSTPNTPDSPNTAGASTANPTSSDSNPPTAQSPNHQATHSPNQQTTQSPNSAQADQESTQLTTADREAAMRRSLGLSHRVYGPLMQEMNDLVHAIVILLVLAIPFAFAMERLLVCATSIYGRIIGFVVTFLITFGLLYELHPGFAIATTPIIIFLAFAIILLSSMVIYILTRKFRVELQAMQGQSAGAHELAASRAGTLLAAVGMGMSTMRRRPTRTTLTAVTVVMLTFTILCFASFSQQIGIRSVYEGPVAQSMPKGVLLRNLDYSEMPEATLDLLHGEPGQGGLISPQYWLTPSAGSNTQSRWSVSIVKPSTGKSVALNALMGVDVESIKQKRWPALARAISRQSTDKEVTKLNDGGVYLPPVARDLLDLKPGDKLLVQGRPATFAGVLATSNLQRLRHIDSEPALPVDFTDVSSFMTQDSGGGSSEDPMIVQDVQRDFVHLSADQVAVVSNDLARQAGGTLHLLTVYPGPSVPADELGRTLAKTTVMPIWAAGREGVEKMLMTRLTQVAGGMQLFVPLLLGGLIIFGTLLGSISDREREIYTFSALGLSPGHVGVLFFAEAAVYAVVGGMGGQLLAQIVALVATELTKAGLISPITINYSSTNSIFAMAVVMATVIISAIYPAYRASKSANPGLARSWKMPKPEGDDLKMVFPFTVSAYDITGIVAFLAEHFRRHDDAGLGSFAASDVEIRRADNGELQLESHLALAPFDLGVTQRLTLTAVASEIPGVDEVAVHAHRLSGASGDWVRSNRVFMRDLRRQFLLWRTLTSDMIEQYRLETLQTLGEAEDAEEELADTQPPVSNQGQLAGA